MSRSQFDSGVFAVIVTRYARSAGAGRTSRAGRHPNRVAATSKGCRQAGAKVEVNTAQQAQIVCTEEQRQRIIALREQLDAEAR
jgi:hypothetical protein